MLHSQSIQGLATEWRGHATTLREYGAGAQAEVLERCAGRLEAELQKAAVQVLDLREAAQLSGYSVDHLSRLIRKGRLPNAGRRGAPRLRRSDVPTKLGYVAPTSSKPEVGLEQIVRSVIDEGVG